MKRTKKVLGIVAITAIIISLTAIIISLVSLRSCCENKEAERVNLLRGITIELDNDAEKEDEKTSEKEDEKASKKEDEKASEKEDGKTSEKEDGKTSEKEAEKETETPKAPEPSKALEPIETPKDDEQVSKKKNLKKTDIIVTVFKKVPYTGKKVKAVEVTLKPRVTANIEIEYRQNKKKVGKAVNVGEYTVIVTAKGTGEYEGVIKVERNFEITPKKLSKEDVTITGAENQLYDGETKDVLSNLKLSLKKGVTAKVVYANCYDVNKNPVFNITNVGEYIIEMTVRGYGNYTGTVVKEITVKILPKQIEEKDIEAIIVEENLIYNGNEQAVIKDVKFLDGVTGSIESIKCYQNDIATIPVKAGEYIVRVAIRGTGNYTGSVVKEVTVKILPKTLKESDVKTIEIEENLIYNGEAQALVKDVQLIDNVTAIIESINCYQNGVETIPVNAGEYIVRVAIRGTGNYTGSVVKEVTVKILPKTLKESDVKTIEIEENLIYNGAEKKVIKDVKMIHGVTAIIESINCYQNGVETIPVNAGEYIMIVTIKGTGNYTGTVEVKKTVQIEKATVDPKAISAMVFKGKTFEYNPQRFYSIYVENIPSEVLEVIYEGNEQNEEGRYVVIAKFVMNPNYKEIQPLTAEIIIINSSSEKPGEGEQEKPDGDKEDENPDNSGQENPGEDNNQGENPEDGPQEGTDGDDNQGEENPEDEEQEGADGDNNQGENPEDEVMKGPEGEENPEDEVMKGPEGEENPEDEIMKGPEGEENPAGEILRISEECNLFVEEEAGKHLKPAFLHIVKEIGKIRISEKERGMSCLAAHFSFFV